jgi:hypothetical protein
VHQAAGSYRELDVLEMQRKRLRFVILEMSPVRPRTCPSQCPFVALRATYLFDDYLGWAKSSMQRSEAAGAWVLRFISKRT